MNTICYLEHPSPVGSLRLVASSEGLVAIHMERQRHMPLEAHPGWNRVPSSNHDADAILRATCTQLDQYFAGRRRTFDLPLAAEGTDFQRLVWQALLTIDYGKTMSYAELARRVGRDKAARAVGLANGRNPLSIVVPCHRVVGADGSMTGYGGGIERKLFLLKHESSGDGMGRDTSVQARLTLV